MFDLTQLEQLLAIDKHKTLSKAAEELHISQPALSRSMQRLEEELEVSLFERQKNKMTFNEDGLLAIEYARKILNLTDEMKSTIQETSKSRNTISIGSIAPAPLWDLTSQTEEKFPNKTIHAQLDTHENLEKGLLDNTFQLIITNDPTTSDDIVCMEYCEEDLYVALPPAHPLASRKEVSLSDLNGLSILQYTDVGFWLDICKKKMPDSMFLMQNEMNVLNELRKSSILPTFATNLTGDTPENEHRVMVPISDDEVNVIFYLKYKKTNRKMFHSISPLV